MTFKDEIENYVGIFTDVTALSLWLNEGAQFILMRLPEEVVRHLAVSQTVTAGGLAIYGKRVLDAHVNYYKSREYPASMKGRLINNASIYNATNTSPAHIIDDGKIYIYPSGGTVIVVTLPTTISYNDVTMVSIPVDMVHAVILYAAIQAQIYKINALNVSGITLSLPIVPTTPSAPSFTFTKVSPAIIALTTIGSLGASPSYSVSLPTVPTFDLTAIGTAPIALPAPAFVYADAVADIINITKLIDLTSAFTLVDTYVDTSHDYELAQGKINEIQAKIQEFIAESNLALQEATKNAELAIDTDLRNGLQQLTTQIQEYTAKVQKYSNELSKYQIDINTKAQEYQLTLNAWTSNTQTILANELNNFQSEVVPYQANLQKIIAQAQLDQQALLQIASNADNVEIQNEARELERQISEYRTTLEKFSNDLQSYNVEVNGEISKANFLLNQYNAQYTLMQGVLVNLQNEFNRFLNYYGIK